MRDKSKRIIWSGLAVVAMLALSLLATPPTFADGGRDIRLQDKCDPATFNAALGPGACVGSGNVTFTKFLDKLNPKDGGHGAWNFSRKELDINAGQVVQLSNQGGEPHTFTEVRNFGTGLVPELNPALPPNTPPAIPVDPTFFQNLPNSFLAELIVPGQSKNVSGLTPGTHLFECLIHPWMRSVIEVRSH